MEPIRKVMGPRTGLEGPEAAHGLWRAARDDRHPDDRERPRKDRPKRPAGAAVRRDDEGRPRVDVQA